MIEAVLVLAAKGRIQKEKKKRRSKNVTPKDAAKRTEQTKPIKP